LDFADCEFGSVCFLHARIHNSGSLSVVLGCGFLYGEAFFGWYDDAMMHASLGTREVGAISYLGLGIVGLVFWFLPLQDYGIFDFYRAHGCVAVEDPEDDFSRDGFCYVVFYEGRTVKPLFVFYNFFLWIFSTSVNNSSGI